MKKINDLMMKMYVKATCAAYNFKNSERGDTNFVSMLLIIGIVVVLAGAFLVFGDGFMDKIGKLVNDWADKLHPESL